MYREIYTHLKENGHILRVLDDKNLKGQVEEKAIQNVVVAFMNDYESLSGEGSLIDELLKRHDLDEIHHLIWFVWTLRKDEDNKLKDKVYELWPLLLDSLDLSSKEDQMLASDICAWAVFVEEIDDETKAFLLAVAPFADVSHNGYELLENLARLSAKQPFQANEIWQKMLHEKAVDYPEEAIRELLSNLVAQGPMGIRVAKETVSLYIKKGVERPSVWLHELSKGREFNE